MDQSSLHIRFATSDDLDAIARIWAAGWAEVHEGRVPDELVAHRRFPELRQAVAGRLDDTRVAACGGDVAGFVIVHGDELEHIYVAMAARGTGIAGRLLATAEAAIALHASVAWLAVVQSNAGARGFYARHGWTCLGEFAHQARVASGTVLVRTVRYHKQVR